MTETKLKFDYEITEEKNGIPVIIVAAGTSSRMGRNKLYIEISGIPVIARTLLNFERSDSISRIIIVTRSEEIINLQLICEKYGISKLSDITEGGKTRQESVLCGLERLSGDEERVLIHDGARPLTSQRVIYDVADKLNTASAVTCAVKVKDTVKEIDSDGKVIKTLKRESLVAVQTPQGVRIKDYFDAVSKVSDISVFTDDTSIMESAGYDVYITEGDYTNIKVTTPEDISAAESYINTLTTE